MDMRAYLRGDKNNIYSSYRNHQWTHLTDYGAWLAPLVVQTLYLEPANPWGNGYIEGLKGELRDKGLNGEIIYAPKEAHVMIERSRQ